MKKNRLYVAIIIVILLIFIWLSGILVDPYWRDQWPENQAQLGGQWIYEVVIHFKDGHNESLKPNLEKPLTVQYSSQPISSVSYHLLLEITDAGGIYQGAYVIMQNMSLNQGVLNGGSWGIGRNPGWNTTMGASDNWGTDLVLINNPLGEWGHYYDCNPGSPVEVAYQEMNIDGWWNERQPDHVNYPEGSYTIQWQFSPSKHFWVVPKYISGGSAPAFAQNFIGMACLAQIIVDCQRDGVVIDFDTNLNPT